MSEMKRKTGWIIEVMNPENKSIQDLCVEIINNDPLLHQQYKELGWSDEPSDKVEALFSGEIGKCKLGYSYMVCGGKLWRYDIKDEDYYAGHATAHKNGDGYNFDVAYHNGGCCHEEAIADALKTVL